MRDPVHAGHSDCCIVVASNVWSVCCVPSVEDEDARHLHRELANRKTERTRHSNRIKGLLICHGIRIQTISKDLCQRLKSMQLPDGSSLPSGLQSRVASEFEARQLADQQVKRLEQAQQQAIREVDSPAMEKVRRLTQLTSVGPHTAWISVHEFFGWRDFQTQKAVPTERDQFWGMSHSALIF